MFSLRGSLIYVENMSIISREEMVLLSTITASGTVSSYFSDQKEKRT